MFFDDIELSIREARTSDEPAIRQLIFAILEEFGLKPDPDGTDKDLFDIESSYQVRGGSFEVVEDEAGRIVGTLGLYPLDRSTVELRKMYLSADTRGRGIGRKLLDRAISQARVMNFERIYLETASVLQAASSLYRSAGFRPVDIVHSPRCDQGYILELRPKL